ncbi:MULTISPECIES: MurR/RpiR family transcriptional regulator [Pediococcus]|uniref:Transcriptional regulator, RpiR family n=1 Tax=Pediococcus pentosaceus (strain ATCC 25745 / CCUG 21536 / LMG 10740 / 183-1w) TaxID=278197 RepID=Q03FC5_PEDPA|nr:MULTISPECIES: MurR/RpiR family transcriptional regulator [Pediococcus]ABJ68097.1 transcriptional regulator, RpiR family [Pediococcus pentosaceus ATCC 25745]MCI2960535.1 MurR/RpiR family transcriptional regulator [Pediococcus pentosaceus]QHM64360.1 putative HTH-type transcriptional regulator YbbH [Pediococcus pentosaceus]QHM67825.1 putative HTH-type transcriptional regulator YbbH [Pediococcus pentosaceus]QHM68021.1 putative HTH-type transcriptional regulator YbbH [Pediococcus pentosaceus]
MKNILFTLSNDFEKFSRSEQKVARFMIDYPREVIQMNAEEISDRTQVSPATVVRLAKKICKSGLPGLKIQVASEIKVDDSLYTEVNPSDDLDVMKHKLEFRISHAIGQTNQILLKNDVKKATDIVEQADDIYVFGMGASNLVAEDFQQKFIRIGKSVIQTLDTHLMAVGLAKPNSVLIVVSDSGETKESCHITRVASSLNIPIIAITHERNSTIAKNSTVTLTHDDGGESGVLRTAATTSLLAQLYVVDLLYYAYLTQDFSNNKARLVKSKTIIAENFGK